MNGFLGWVFTGRAMGVLCLVFSSVFSKGKLLTYSCVISVHKTDVKGKACTSLWKIITLGSISTF